MELGQVTQAGGDLLLRSNYTKSMMQEMLEAGGVMDTMHELTADD